MVNRISAQIILRWKRGQVKEMKFVQQLLEKRFPLAEITRFLTKIPSGFREKTLGTFGGVISSMGISREGITGHVDVHLFDILATNHNIVTHSYTKACMESIAFIRVKADEAVHACKYERVAKLGGRYKKSDKIPLLQRKPCVTCHKQLAVEFQQLKCALCNRALYCDKVCQTADWKAGHRETCAGKVEK